MPLHPLPQREHVRDVARRLGAEAVLPDGRRAAVVRAEREPLVAAEPLEQVREERGARRGRCRRPCAGSASRRRRSRRSPRSRASPASRRARRPPRRRGSGAPTPARRGRGRAAGRRRSGAPSTPSSPTPSAGRRAGCSGPTRRAPRASPGLRCRPGRGRRAAGSARAPSASSARTARRRRRGARPRGAGGTGARTRPTRPSPCRRIRLPSSGVPSRPSAVRVLIPAMPSTCSEARIWNARIAAAVAGPAMPSISPAYRPCARSAT